MFYLESSMCDVQSFFFCRAMFLFVRLFFTNCGAFCKTVMRSLRVPACTCLFPAAYFFFFPINSTEYCWICMFVSVCVCVCVLLKAVIVAVCISAVTECVFCSVKACCARLLCE